jgi:hypothetical protein
MVFPTTGDNFVKETGKGGRPLVIFATNSPRALVARR